MRTFTSPRLVPLAYCLLIGRLVQAPEAAQGPEEASVQIVTTETDEAFDLRAGLAVLRSAGAEPAHVLLAEEGGNTVVSLTLTASQVAVVDARVGGQAPASAALRLSVGKHVLHLKRRAGQLRVIVDGRNALHTNLEHWPAGPIRLVGAEGLRWDPEPRYQPVGPVHLTDDFMTVSRDESPWEPISGVWQLAGVSRPEKAADPFRMLGLAEASGVTLCSNTYWFWSDYCVEAAATLEGNSGGLGLVFAYCGPKDYFVFRWRGAEPKGQGQLQLVHCHRGKEVLLNRKPAWLAAKQWYKLSVATDGNRMLASVDEWPVLEGRSEWLTGGQAGLYVEGEGGASFDDFRVSDETDGEANGASAFADWGATPKDFTDDPYMTAWANPARSWERRAEDSLDWHWHRGLFFESATVEWRKGDGAKTKPPRSFSLLTPDGTSAAGYRVDLPAAAAGEVVLSRVGQETARGRLPGDALSQLTVSADRGAVLVTTGEETVLEWTDPQPLTCGRVGVVFADKRVSRRDFASLALSSANWLDYRFDKAPVDWEVESGEWRASNRWACVPGWNFFGGVGKPVATLWNKRGFGSDLHLDAFVAPREGTSDRMHFAFPINLNLTFCAADRKLGAGYSVVYRAQDQSTLLFRKGELVAETADLVRAGWRKRQMEVYYAVTQTWQHLEVLKRGGKIQVFAEVPTDAQKVLDRKLLIEYEDPQPLAGNEVAFWTYGDNGMAMARVRIASPVLSPPQPRFLKPPIASDKPGVFVNRQNGGRMQTDLLGTPLDASAHPVVRFRYFADPGANVALYAETHNQRFRFDLLGDTEADGDSVVLGSLASEAEGRWNVVVVPILQRLRTFYPDATPLSIDKLYLANLSSLPALVGGLKANARGTSYALKDVSFGEPARRARPRLTKQIPPNACPTHLAIQFDDPAFDPRRCQLRLKGRATRLGDRGLRWDGATGQLLLNLSAMGVSFSEGEEVVLLCETVTAEGKAAPAGRWTWTVAVAEDQQPPPPPTVATCLGPARINTFEQETGGWRTVGGEQGAALWRDDSTAAEGDFSLRLYHRELSGPFAAESGFTPFEVRRYPVLCFDYRIDDGTELNLFVECASRLHEIRMLDDTATWPVIGRVPEVKADGEWHRAEVDLRAMLTAKRLPSPIIDRLLFGDAGWMNNIQDVQWRLDNFQLVSALPAGLPTALQWRANDVSGIAGYSWRFDASPTTTPDETSEGDATSAALPAEAAATYFHVRALDRAGNWGPPAHFHFARQTEAVPQPAVSTCTPADGVEAAGPRVAVSFTPPNAIDVEGLELTVAMGEQLVTVQHGDEGVHLDLAKGTFGWEGARNDLVAKWPDQGTVECDLKYRGLTEVDTREHKWSWRLNRALDKQGPPAPYVSYVPTNRLCRYDFEGGDFGDAGIRRSAWVVLDDASPAATGSGSLRSLNLEANDFFSTYLRKLPFAVHDYPRVAFDYRFERGGCNLILVSLVNGDMQVIDFAGQNTSYNVFRENRIGTVGQTKQDGNWRHVAVDFRELLSKRYPQTTRFLAKYLGTWATGARTTYDNPQGVSHWLDNLTVYSPKSDSAAFEWQAPADENGIAAYAYVLDQKADTVPPPKVSTRETRCECSDLAPGTWHFHVRAVDGAGNWGETAHAAFELQ